MIVSTKSQNCARTEFSKSFNRIRTFETGQQLKASTWSKVFYFFRTVAIGALLRGTD